MLDSEIQTSHIQILKNDLDYLKKNFFPAEIENIFF